MWWLIIIAFYAVGITTRVLSNKQDQMVKEGVSEDDPKKRRINRAFNISLGTLIVIVCIPIFYVLGWLWYFFCGGFLMWVDDAWYMKIVYGFMSLIFLSILIGVIAIIFGGWKPYK